MPSKVRTRDKKKQFKVFVDFSTGVVLEVTAEDEEEAQDKAESWAVKHKGFLQDDLMEHATVDNVEITEDDMDADYIIGEDGKIK